MLRRTFFKTIMASLAAAGAVAASTAKAAETAPKKLKVVYHLSDQDKVNFVLGNIRNHYKGVEGPENVEIALVVHGPALKAFHDLGASDKVRERLATLGGQGLKLNACGNTMRAQSVKTEDLLPGFVRVDQGGVVRLAELQAEGYLYLRP